MGSEEADFEAAGKQIEAMQDGLRNLTVIIGSCSSNSDRRVNATRTEIFRSAQLYRALHLKASVAFITCLDQVISSFTDFSPENFAKSIHTIAERSAGYADQAQLVHDLHLLFYSDTKDLVERAKRTAAEIRREAGNHTVAANDQAWKARRHNEKAKRGTAVAILLTVVSIVFAIPTMGLSCFCLVPVPVAGEYVAHHVAKQEAATSNFEERAGDAENALRAAVEMAGPVSHYAMTFSDAIRVATTFFSNVNYQLQSFKQKAEKARSSADREEINQKLRLHCTKMRRPAANLKSLCENFLRTAPIIDAEISRICGGSDISYVQNWLKKHEIELGYWRAKTALRLTGT